MFDTAHITVRAYNDDHEPKYFFGRVCLEHSVQCPCPFVDAATSGRATLHHTEDAEGRRGDTHFKNEVAFGKYIFSSTLDTPVTNFNCISLTFLEFPSQTRIFTHALIFQTTAEMYIYGISSVCGTF